MESRDATRPERPLAVARGARRRAGTETMARVMAIDIGDRRIGLAVSDPSGMIASPAGHVLRRPGKRPPLTLILERARELEATEFVVGLPLDQEGEETDRSAEARRLARSITERTGARVRLVDERYTTAMALRTVQEMGGSTRGRKGDVDALAATVLLQHALAMSEPQS